VSWASPSKKIEVIQDSSINILFANVPNISFEEIETKLEGYITSSEYEKRRHEEDNPLYGFTLLDEVKRYASLVGRLAKQNEFDVIHAHDWLSYLAGVAAKKATGKPLVVHVHATGFDQAGGENVHPEVYRIEKYGMEEADIVITVSEFTRQMVLEKYGIDPNKVRVVHNGIILEEKIPSDGGNLMRLKQAGNKIVLYIGRITIQKGVDYFLSAAKKVLEHEPNTYFIIAGAGDMEAQLIRQAGELGITDRVLFNMGKYVRGKEKADLIAASDLFVMPSVSEPFGLVPLEVLLEAGTPVLISKQSGVSEVMQHALKVDFWDVDEMANKIVAALRHDPLRNQLSEKGREEAGGVTWHKAAEKCSQIYHDVINMIKNKQ
jgi:glycosyltransferase involved in cell wall biosynthesis